MLEGDVTAVTSPLNLGRPWSAGRCRLGLVWPGEIRATAGRPATAGGDGPVMAMLQHRLRALGRAMFPHDNIACRGAY